MGKKDSSIYGHKIENANEDNKALVGISATGEILHSFIDGCLIGAIFSVDITTGWITTLTILLHGKFMSAFCTAVHLYLEIEKIFIALNLLFTELPQELGDFALYLSTGMSVSRALVLNIGVSCFSLLGSIIVIAIGKSFEVTAILPICGGTFLYLGKRLQSAIRLFQTLSFLCIR